jgi:hypothetical protein
LEGAEAGTCIPSAVETWHLSQDDVSEVVPLRSLGEKKDNPEAGWLNSGPGEVVVVVTESRDTGELEVWTTYGNAACVGLSTESGLSHWSCEFGEGFAGDGSEVEVKLQFGEESEQAKVFRVDTQGPELVFTLTGSGTDGKGTPGGTIKVCAEANTQGAPLALLEFGDGDIEASLEGLAPVSLPLDWTLSEDSPEKICYSAQLPELLEFNDTDMLSVAVRAEATDAARNKTTEADTKQLGLTHVGAELSLMGNLETTLPLAWTGGHVVIGMTNAASGSGYVYFYNPVDGTLSNSENVGPLSGLATLGDSGRVAITTLESTSGMKARASVVGTDGRFVDSNRNTDCVRGENTVPANAILNRGLALLSLGNGDGTGDWRFVVPMNTGSPANTRDRYIMAYAPYESTGNASSNCKRGQDLLWNVITSPVVLSTAEALVLRDYSGIHPEKQKWNGSSWDQIENFQFSNSALKSVTSVAAGAQRFWATATYASVSADVLENGLIEEVGKVTPYSNAGSFGAVALDASSRAYVVVAPLGSSTYELRRYNNPTDLGVITSKPLNKSAPVGSPILGHPISGNAADAEVYVITTDGTVYGFNAGTMEPLWTQSLSITISPKAQPLLKGNRLWVIGTNGELRTLTVKSNGLHRTAYWPKMYRDNCNSSSHLSTYETLPSCF